MSYSSVSRPESGPRHVGMGVYGDIYQLPDGVIAKQMKPPKDANNSTVICKLVREVAVQRYITTISHDIKVVPRIYGFSLGSRQIHMEYGGHTFSQWRHSIPKSKALELLYMIAVKMAYYYSAGMIHGDYSTSNILYDTNANDTMLIDFGSSVVELNSGTHNVQTLIFCSPELLLMKMDRNIPSSLIKLDVSSEIWSFGIIAYLMLSKSSLPSGVSGNVEAVTRITLANYKQLFGPWQRLDKFDLPAPSFQPMENSQHLDGIDIEFLRFVCQYEPKKRPSWKDILMHPIFDVIQNRRVFLPFHIGKIDMSIEKPFYGQIVQSRVRNNHSKLTNLLLGKSLSLSELSVAKSILNSIPEIPNPSISAVLDITKCVCCDSLTDQDIEIQLENMRPILSSCISILNVCSLLPIRETEYNIIWWRQAIVAIYLYGKYESYVDILRDSKILYREIRDAPSSSLTWRIWKGIQRELDILV